MARHKSLHVTCMAVQSRVTTSRTAGHVANRLLKDIRAMADHAEESSVPCRKKPSAAWRSGFLLYDGWPAQEDGTDSHLHSKRRSHDALQPSAVGVCLEPRPDPGAVWTSRYPVWWADAPPASPPKRTDAAAFPGRDFEADKEEDGDARYVWDLPVPKPVPFESIAFGAQGGGNQASLPADVEGDSEEAATPPVVRCTQQTQTPRTGKGPKGGVQRLRQPLMPCMRNAAKARPQAESRVAISLRRDQALQKQLAQARRRRCGSRKPRS